MITPELIKTIKKLTLKTRRLMAGSRAGDYKAHVRGSGFEFDQLREYQEGDDIRFIDWQSTARTGSMMVREYRQERTRTIGIILDNSASMYYGSGAELKYTSALQVAACLAYAGWYGKDQVGVMVTASDTPKILPPTQKANLTTFLNLVTTDFYHTSSLEQVVEPCFSLLPKNSLIIIISDFIDENYRKVLKQLSRNYDLIALRMSDPTEISFPALSDIIIKDNESLCSMRLSNTDQLDRFIIEWRQDFVVLCKKLGIDYSDIVVGEPFIEKLLNFFNKRKTTL